MSSTANISRLEIGPRQVRWPTTEDPHPQSPPPNRLVSAFPSLAGLVLIVALAPLNRVWLVAIFLAALTLTLPGILLLRALAVPTHTVRRFPLLIPAAAVFVVSFAGMGADLIGPHVGIAKPLHGDTTELTTVGVCLVLWALGLGRQDDARLNWAGALSSAQLLWPLLLPLLSAAGALLLTNNHGAGVAGVAAVAMPLVLLFCLIRANRVSRGQTAMLLFACALAAEWAFSLRSQEIVGYDISTEVGLANHVHSVGIWHLNEKGNAYGAMLSLTVFPATLAQIAGISPLIAFKVLYPIFTAMLPVAIFLVGERFIQRRYAAAAASLLLVQYYFFQQLAQIARQEIGLLFFAALVAVLFDRWSTGAVRLRLAIMAALGMVVSHYSSVYFGVVFLLLSLPFFLVASRFRIRSRMAALLATALVVVAGGAALYYGPVTHSASNLTSFTKVLSQDGFDLFPSSSGNFVKAYLNENTNTSVSVSKFERLAVKQYKNRDSYIHPLKAAYQPKYRLKAATVPAPKGRFGSIAGLLGIFNTLFGQLMLLFCGVGSLVALFSKDRRLRVVGVFGLAMIVVLLIFRFSATLAASYNQTRALLQALLIMAIPAGVLADRLARRLPRLVSVLVIAALALMFAIQDGAAWLVFGGGQPMNLAQGGEAFERFYETPAELAGASWVANASDRKLVYSDEYGGLRLQAAAQLYPLEFVTPKTLDQHAWVYGTRTNDLLGRARGQVNPDYALYVWPKQYLNDNYDTVFDDGDTKIWHR